MMEGLRSGFVQIMTDPNLEIQKLEDQDPQHCWDTSDIYTFLYNVLWPLTTIILE
jgi:hypothetical protein